MFPSTASLDSCAAPAASAPPAVSHLLRRVHSRAQTAGRMLFSGVAALALLTTTSLTYAQGGPLASTCSEDERQGLARVGGWAAAQCASVDLLFSSVAPQDAPAPPTTSSCSETADGLARVGGWALDACITVGGSAS